MVDQKEKKKAKREDLEGRPGRKIMSEAAVSFVLENLKQILVYNSHLIADVRENVEKLCDQLKILNGFVKDYTEMNSNTEALKALRRELKSVVSEAEDVVDKYIVHASMQKARGKVEKVLKIVDYGSKLRDLGKEIEQVSGRVKVILESQIVPRLEAAQIQDIANERAKKKQVKEKKLELFIFSVIYCYLLHF